VSSPSLHDHITHIGLRLAKSGRDRCSGNHREFYQRFFLEKHLDESKYDLRARLRREAIKQVISERRLPPRPVMADIGAGVGDVIESMPENAMRIAVAYSSEDLTLARKACGDKIRFVNASAFALPFASESIDIVLCLEVIEHLPDDRAALKEMARVLKSAGIMVLSVPSHHYFPDYLELIGHYRHYSSESLGRLLATQNLRIVRHIDGQHLINVLHYYPYIALQALHSTFDRLGWRAASMYVRPYLGALYQVVARVLIMLSREKSQAALGADDRATFVAATKVPEGV
jgi:2-polyprenyl-3-methyl-5-hydroxy-6-metoxy-1,4-benzoquinol methylase